jgi:ribonuclease R
MVGEASGETYRLGDQVEVKLVEAAPMAGALRFEMLTPGTKSNIKGRVSKGAFRKGRNGKYSSRKKPGTTRPRRKSGRR